MPSASTVLAVVVIVGLIALGAGQAAWRTLPHSTLAGAVVEKSPGQACIDVCATQCAQQANGTCVAACKGKCAG